MLPAHSTAYSQPLDIAINKLFKSCIHNLYSDWLVQNIQETRGHTAVDRETIRSWVSTACSKRTSEAVKKAFECVGIGVPLENQDQVSWRIIRSLQRTMAGEENQQESQQEQEEREQTQTLPQALLSTPIIWHANTGECPWYPFFSVAQTTGPYPCVLRTPSRISGSAIKILVLELCLVNHCVLLVLYLPPQSARLESKQYFMEGYPRWSR